MEFHFVGEDPFELSEAFDTRGGAGGLIEEQPVHIRLSRVQPRHGDDQLPEGVDQRRLFGTQVPGRFQQRLGSVPQVPVSRAVRPCRGHSDKRVPMETPASSAILLVVVAA